MERLSIVAGLREWRATTANGDDVGGAVRRRGWWDGEEGWQGTKGTTSRALCSNFRASCAEKFEAKKKRKVKKEKGKSKKEERVFLPGGASRAERHN